MTPIEYGALDFLNKIAPISYHLNKRTSYIDDIKNLSKEELNNKIKYGLCSYDKEQHKLGTKKEPELEVGVSAQEVQKALTKIYGTSTYGNLVKNNLEKYAKEEIPEGVEEQLSINYINFIPFLIKAIQELNQ